MNWKSPNYKINEIKENMQYIITDNYSSESLYYYTILRHKLNYDDKLKEVGKRVKLNHRIDRSFNSDVAHGTLETIYAVFSIIKRLIANKIKGGLK
tara:strand:- start:245 stop:532 length:288 start_codon:yes stop_codon:yes gene_type:complete